MTFKAKYINNVLWKWIHEEQIMFMRQMHENNAPIFKQITECIHPNER